MSKLNRILWTGLVLVGAACGDDVTVQPPAPPPAPEVGVTGVTVAPDQANLGVGSTLQMTAAVTCTPATDNCSTATVAFHSGDATKATVSASGVVTGVAVGDVAITATATLGTSSASGEATLHVVAAAACVINGVTVTPTNADMVPGQTLTLAAVASGSNCSPDQLSAFDYSSSDAAIATVSATGVVTAVAGGTTAITAASHTDGSKKAAMSVKVTVPSPATLSIQSVTQGALGSPVNLANVGGQIEVSLNVDRGDKTLDRVDVLIGGQVVASQTFSQASAKAASPAQATAPVTVVQSVNTRQVVSAPHITGDVGPFVPVVFNGQSFITANLYVVGASAPIASNAVPVLMNNSDAAISPHTLTDVSTAAPEPYIDGAGHSWYKGDVHAAFNYIAFSNTTPTSSTTDIDGCGGETSTVTGTPTTGITVDNDWACAAAEGPIEIEGPDETEWAVPIGPDGSALRGPEVGMPNPLPPPAPAIVPPGYSEVAGRFTLPGDLQRWNLITPSPFANPTYYVDNRAPFVEVAGQILIPPAHTKSKVAFNALFDQPWIGIGYVFTKSDLNAVPAFYGDLYAQDGGTGVKATYPRARTITGAGTVLSPTICGPEVTGSGDLAETFTSNATDGVRITSYALDNLDNASTCEDANGPPYIAYNVLSNYFGVDLHVPGARLAGIPSNPPFAPNTLPAVSPIQNTTIFGPGFAATVAPAFDPTNAWALEGLDDRSGFDQNNLVPGMPNGELLTWLWPGGPVPGLTSACGLFTNALNVVLPDNFVRSAVPVVLDCASGNPGYYNFFGVVTDRAGNQSAPITRNFAIDQYAPPVANSVNLASVLYTPGQPAGFAVFGSDDLEIINASLQLSYPVTGGPIVLGYLPSAVGTRWDGTLTNLLLGQSANITYLVGRADLTCTGAGAPYASCLGLDQVDKVSAEYDDVAPNTDDAKNPTSVIAVLSDVSGAGTATGPASILSLQVGDVAEQWAAADLIAWRIYRTTVPNPPPAPATNLLNGEHKASTSIVVPYFDRAFLARQIFGAVTVCLEFSPPAPSDNGFNRFWTYSSVQPSTGPCADGQPGVGNWLVVGVKAGAALVSTNIP